MKNKQKAWRLRARKLKAVAVARGVHERGNRYGRVSRNVYAFMQKMQPAVTGPMSALLLPFMPKVMGTTTGRLTDSAPTWQELPHQ